MEETDNLKNTSFNLIIPVHLIDWVNALYRVVALDANNNEITVSEEIDLLSTVASEQVIGYFKPSNKDSFPGNHFGASIALSADGNTMAIGAIDEISHTIDTDGYPNTNRGSVYVFKRNIPGVWIEQSYIKGSYQGEQGFGLNVALSADGNALAVQTFNRVYVFTRNNEGNWTEQYLNSFGERRTAEAGDKSLVLSPDGNTLVVGNYTESRVYFFIRITGLRLIPLWG